MANLVDTIKEITDDSLGLVDVLKPKAAKDNEISKKDKEAIARLIRRSEEAMSAARQQAKTKRRQQIDILKGQIESLSSTLASPRQSAKVRQELAAMRRQKRSRLLRLTNREALDFAGILSAAQVQQIEDVLARAKQDVANRKKAAAFLATLMKITDIALSIISKIV